MAERRPLIVRDGRIEEMPSGDTISTTIAPGSGGGSGATAFLSLTDTPATFGTEGQMLAVNAATDALEWVDAPTGGGTSTGAINTLRVPATPGNTLDAATTSATSSATKGNLLTASQNLELTKVTTYIGGNNIGNFEFVIAEATTDNQVGTVIGTKTVTSVTGDEELVFIFDSPIELTKDTDYFFLLTDQTGTANEVLDMHAGNEAVTGVLVSKTLGGHISDVDITGGEAFSNFSSTYLYMEMDVTIIYNVSGSMNSLLTGTVDPTTEGVDGDVYINTSTNMIFGPKAAGSWPSGTSLVGPAGVSAPFRGFRAVSDGTEAPTITTLTTMAFQNEVFDTESAYDSTTGIFTVPASLDGTYMEFSAGIRTSATDSTLYLYQNAVNIAQSHGQAFRAIISSGPVLVSTGDEFKIQVYSPSSATAVADVSFFSGYVINGIKGDPGPAGPSGSNMVQTELTGTTHTVNNTDLAGNVVRRLNNAAAITVTVAPSLTGTEPSTWIQTGVGQVTFAAGAGVTILSADGNLSIAAQYGSASLIPDADTADTYYLVGHLTT